MKQFIFNAMTAVLLMFGMLGILNIKSVTPNQIASIYLEIHGGGK